MAKVDAIKNLLKNEKNRIYAIQLVNDQIILRNIDKEWETVHYEFSNDENFLLVETTIQSPFGIQPKVVKFVALEDIQEVILLAPSKAETDDIFNTYGGGN